MQKTLLIKAVLVAAVFLVLLVPLAMIRGIVVERAARQHAVVQEVAASSFGKQSLVGLVLSIPYVEEYDADVGEGRDKRVEKMRIERTLRIFSGEPAELGGNRNRRREAPRPVSRCERSSGI